MKKLILLMMLVTQLRATTISLHLKTPSITNVTKGSYVKFELKNYGSGLPRTTGGIIVPSSVNFYPDSNGLVAGSIIGNDIITPTGTYYTVSYISNGIKLYSENCTITGSSMNFDNSNCNAVPIPPVPPTILFSDNFSTCNFSNWSNFSSLWNTDIPFIEYTIVHSNTCSYGQQYQANPTGGNRGDVNRWIAVILVPQSEIWVRDWIYIKSPELDSAPLATTIFQRKLIEFGDSNSIGNCCGLWEPVLTSYNATGGLPTTDNRLAFVTSPCGNSSVEHDDLGTFAFNSWHEFQVHLKLDTGNLSNGVVEIYLDDMVNPVYHSTTEILRGTCTTQLTGYFFGRQVDSTPNMPIDEYRYHDDITISKSGPLS